jgi:hypothetical protein
MVYNPSLRQEPVDQPAAVIPTKQNASILDWLDQTGRLMARQPGDFDYSDDEEEINELMGNEDSSFDLDEDDDLGDLDD